MPVSILPPHSRRQWLRTSLAAGLGTLWCHNDLHSAESGADTWALLSDTHISSNPDEEAHGVVMSQNLDRVLDEVVALTNVPQAVLINGDCAYLKGLPGDYEVLAARLEKAVRHRLPVHCALGNHDDRAVFRQTLEKLGAGRGEAAFSDKHVTVLTGKHMTRLILDSLDVVDQVQGELGEGQMQWLRTVLATLKERKVGIVMHHNPQAEVPEGKRLTGLKDTLTLYQLLRESPQVKLLVYGHTHNWNSLPPAEGLPWRINLPPVAYVFDKARPNGWVHATATPDKLTLELRSLDPAHPQHLQKVEIPLG